MRNLLDFINAHFHWFVFLLLEVMGLTLLFRHNSLQSAAFMSTANTVAAKVYEAESAVKHYFHLAHLNEELTMRNAYLEHEVQTLSEKLDEQKGDSTYRALSASSVLQSYRLTPAKVVQNSIHERDNYMTIDKGTADGVHPDMGVISGKGVVGIVYLSADHYSVVIPVLSSKSSISCMIQRRGYFGYLRWDGKASNIAYVDDVPRHARFAIGDRIVTSGYSSVFPPGIAVGKIIHVFNSADGLSYSVQVQLYTDFGNVRDVLVIDDALMRERLRILRAAQDSIKSETQ
ncbi:MAG: rod shape-determining protein MreC [Prevotella sp.]|nr:rod shape-determining protein MreC [Prevotella sp.]